MRASKPKTDSRPSRQFAPPTPFTIVVNPLPEDQFHRKLPRLRDGHFKNALSMLASAKRGSVLKFASRKCYGQVEKAAKQLGYECWYALDSDALLVQLVDTGKDK